MPTPAKREGLAAKPLSERLRDTWEEVQHSIGSKGYVDEGHRGAFDSIIAQVATLESQPQSRLLIEEAVAKIEAQTKGDYETGSDGRDLYKEGTIAELLAWIEFDFDKEWLSEFDLKRRCEAIIKRLNSTAETLKASPTASEAKA